jgi:hypothetical protein
MEVARNSELGGMECAGAAIGPVLSAALALSEVHRVTKPGGPIAVAVWGYRAGMRMLRVFWDAARTVDRTAEPFDELHMPLCRDGELAALWKEEGLGECDRAAARHSDAVRVLCGLLGPIPSRPGPRWCMCAESMSGVEECWALR